MVPSCVTSVPKVLLLVFKPRALELLDPSKFGLEMLENPLVELVNNVEGCSAELGWGTVKVKFFQKSNSMKLFQPHLNFPPTQNLS